jgi:uncharacterized protein (DUF1499 family)
MAFTLLLAITSVQSPRAEQAGTRRAALSSLARVALASIPLGAALPALAFENGVPEMDKYKDRPKQRGPKPSDIGLRPRVVNVDGDIAEGSLKICGPAPNCFSTTGDASVPGDSAHIIAPWQPPAGASAEEAIAQVVEAIKAYTPGQSGIDGGGFRLVTVQPNYVYAQFESLRQGYVDDVEFATGPAPGSAVQVRSSSRLGYLDFGVNALRLNAIGDKLRARGWKAAEISEKSHPEYFAANRPRR